MAKNIRQPVDDKGKLVYLSLNKAKYITIKDGDGNKYATTGSQFLVWYDPIHWIRLGDGTEIESKYEGLYDVVYKEVAAAITNLRAHVDTRSFKEQKAQKDEEKKKLKASVDKAIDTSKKVQQQTKPAVAAHTHTQHTHVPSPTPKTIPKAVIPPPVPAPSASHMATMSDTSITSLSAFQWKHLSESEMLTMYTLWNEMQGRTSNIKKDFDIIKQNGGTELQEELDQFVLHGLMHKGAVPDNCIPPLSILKKIPEIAGNRDLYLYYERKINKSGGEDKTPEGRLRKANIRGKEILKSSMPQSWKTALGAARLGTDILRVGGSKLASTMGSMVDRMKSPLASGGGATTLAMASATPTSQHVDTTHSLASATPSTQPTHSHTAPTKQGGKKFGLSDKDSKINAEMFKMIGTGLVGIKNVLDKRLPISTTTKAAENKTFANEAEITDKTGDISKGVGKGTEPVKKETGQVKGGIFSKLAGMFGFLLSPMKMFGKVLGGLVGFISPIGKVIGSILSGLSSAIMPLLRMIAPAAATAAAAYAGYKGGQALFKSIGTLDEEGNLSQDSMLSKLNDKLTGFGTPSKPTMLNKSLKDMSDEELQVLNAQRKVAGKPTLDRSAASQQLRDSEHKLNAAQKSSPDLVAAPKNRSNIVDQTVSINDSAKAAKEDNKMKQPIVVNAPTTNSNVSTSGMSMPMTPRTSNSTFQRYNDSKTRLAY